MEKEPPVIGKDGRGITMSECFGLQEDVLQYKQKCQNVH